MKKMFFLILILLAGNFSLVAKNYSEKEIQVRGFDGKNPLKEYTVIFVLYPGCEDWYAEDAYKGENIDSFLKRITAPIDSVEDKKLQVSKPLIPSIGNLDKEEIGLIKNFGEEYHPVYRRPPGGIEKKRYLSLDELEDSLMFAEMKLNLEKKSKTNPVSVSSASQEQKKFEESYLILIAFFVGLVLFFLLFGHIPLIWSTKNKK